MITSYKDLNVWQKSIDLVEEIYSLTKDFPKVEMFGITNQMRRASISIPSNIAEGFARRSMKERSQFYSIAYGSAMELETQLLIAERLGFINKSNFINSKELINEILRMLNKLTSSTRL